MFLLGTAISVGYSSGISYLVRFLLLIMQDAGKDKRRSLFLSGFGEEEEKLLIDFLVLFDEEDD